MPTIKVQNFLGEVPRLPARSLGDNAQKANNLLATAVEFRPLQADTQVATGTANSPSLYRLTSAPGTWLTNGDVSYAKGQLNDDTTERTYVSYDGAAQPPRVIDNAGGDRQLGVPKPTTKPTVTANIVDELSTAEIPAVIDAQITAVKKAITDNLLVRFHGVGFATPAPTATTPGWVLGGVADLPAKSGNELNYLVPIDAMANNAGNATGFRFVNPAFGFLLRPEFGGKRVQYQGVNYYAVAFYVAATTRLLVTDGESPPINNTTALRNALTAIPDPTAPNDPAKKLLTAAEADAIVARVAEATSITSGDASLLRKTVFTATAKLAEVLNVASTGLSAEQAAFYKSAAFTNALDRLVGTTFANNSSDLGDGAYAILSRAYNLVSQDGVTGTNAPRYKANDLETAYANVRADIRAFIYVTADGKFVSDIAGLQTKVANEYQAIVDSKPYGTGADAQAQKMALLNTLNALADEAMAPFRRFISAANLSALGLPSGISADYGAAVLTAIAESKAPLAKLADYYSGFLDTLQGYLEGAVGDGAGARIAEKAVERLVDSRFYVVTFVTDRGEESAPSPVSDLLEVDQNDRVTITRPSAPTGRFITHWRLYRSNVASNGAEFQYVPYRPVTLVGDVVTLGAEDTKGHPIANTDYIDTFKSSQLGEVIATTTWDEPPATIKGFVSMPNGIVAGFDRNYVAFCEPYTPYAWPVEYQITTEHPVVGLGVFGQTLFVGTRGFPYLISGADSATMSAQKLDVAQACTSKRSIVSLGGGVFYACPDGIAFTNGGNPEVVTQGLFAREDWQALNPSSIVAVGYEGQYIFRYSGNGGGCFALDFAAKKLTRIDLSATAFFNDPVTDALFYLDGSAIKQAFNTGRRTGLWRSSKYVFPAQAGFAWVQIDGDQSPTTPATFRWYAEGSATPVYTVSITSVAPLRLPFGRYLEHEIEVESAARISKVLVTSETRELQSA